MATAYAAGMIAGRPHLHGLTWLRAAAALLVLAYHVELTLALPKYLAHPVLPAFRWGQAGVQIFFVLSGFVILYAHHHEPQRDAAAIRGFAVKRFRTIYPPLWIVLAIVVALTLAIAGLRHWTAIDVVAAFLVIPFPRDLLLSVEWTLRHEVFFYLLFAGFLWNRRIGGTILLLWGGASLIAAATMPLAWPFDFVLNANHILFLFGMAVARLHLNGVAHGRRSAIVVAILLFLWLFARDPGPVAQIRVFETLAFGTAAALLIHGLCAPPRWNRRMPWVEACGAASYSLYLIHYPLVSLLSRLAVAVDRLYPVPALVYFVGMVVICQIAAILFHRWLTVPAMAAAGRLTDRVYVPASATR
ncbi:acyltransferase [Sphingomonas sp. KR1UV-12]|uniref:Acyltransferase n=1 Tax=Sphingomonas aurea TaxID=3063994 RepID=A0ABT9EIA1_9SPHN|nr:acyltransferase [Sphingomonas sp. KR1UV-12]MDP1026700.1 acyltransferase [Sphingomonas sp. KR1UV-12]